MESKMAIDQAVKPRSKWQKNSNHSHVATVLWTEGNYVRYEAPWSQTGVLWKAEDSFRAHYTPLQPNTALSRVAGSGSDKNESADSATSA